MAINSRQKGALGEREFAAFLRDTFGVDARRGQQFSGGADSPDVVSSFDGLHFEVKRVEALSLYKAMGQAVRDAGEKKTPVVAHRKNRCDWLLVVRAQDVITFAQEIMAKARFSDAREC